MPSLPEPEQRGKDGPCIFRPSRKLPYVGKKVVVTGLKARPELNGKTVSCLHYDEAKRRYAVQFEGVNEPLGDPLLIKPDNLELPNPGAWRDS